MPTLQEFHFGPAASNFLVTGTTRVIFMIGTPIKQVKSPVLFNRHFAEQAIDKVMVPVEVTEASLAAFVSVVRAASNCDGFVATLPHKRALMGLVDEASDSARALDCVNVVRRERDGRLIGDMADGVGFWDGMQANGFNPCGKAVILAGAGAAGTAIAHEFALRGGRRLTIWARTKAEMRALQSRIQPSGVAVEIGMPASLADFDMAINATPMGMTHAPGTAFSADLILTLRKHALVADAVTEPVETELLRTASACGLTTVSGEAMTLGQMKKLLVCLGLPAA